MRKPRLDEPLLAAKKEMQAPVSEKQNGQHPAVDVDGANEEEVHQGWCCRMCSCTPRWSGNIKTLITVIVLFSVVSIAQLLGSYIANSLSLLGDSISMGIDTLTFIGNLYAECSTSKHRVTIQLVASGVSLVALCLFTISVIVEAVDRLLYSDKCTVDPYIVLGFSFVGLVFDITAFLAYYYWGMDPTDPATTDPSSTANKQKNQKKEICLEDGVEVDVGREMARINMCSALMHVASDALRSITTLIEGLLILYTDLDSENTDAVASLIVSSIIVIGAIGALFSWGHQVARHYRGELISPAQSPPPDLPGGTEKKSDPPAGASHWHKLRDVAGEPPEGLHRRSNGAPAGSTDYSYQAMPR